MNDSLEVEDKPSDVVGPIPFRVRPEAFLIVGLVIVSGYLTAFDRVTTIKINDRVLYEHPDIWPFPDYRMVAAISLDYGAIAFGVITLSVVAMAAAFFYLQWWRGFYSIKALLGLMAVAAVVFSILSIPRNDFMTKSAGRNILRIPMIIGVISLLFVPLHLVFKAVTRSPYSKKRFLDPP